MLVLLTRYKHGTRKLENMPPRHPVQPGHPTHQPHFTKYCHQGLRIMTSSLSRFELNNLPDHEADDFEFKSSLTPIQKLGGKISKAASAFWNSGGGTFIAGVNDNGLSDGGIPKLISRQDVRDWIDQSVHRINPAGQYEVKLFGEDGRIDASLDPDKVVVAIRFEPSHLTPHMADDGRYYIRAGAHSVPANGFIVESLFANRHSQEPKLTHTLRLKPGDNGTVELGIIALTNSSALNVALDLENPPSTMRGDASKTFPMKFPVINRDNPFFMDYTTWYTKDFYQGENTDITITYEDVMGRSYRYDGYVDVGRSIGPLQISNSSELKEIAKHIKSMSNDIGKLSSRFRSDVGSAVRTECDNED